MATATPRDNGTVEFPLGVEEMNRSPPPYCFQGQPPRAKDNMTEVDEQDRNTILKTPVQNCRTQTKKDISFKKWQYVCIAVAIVCIAICVCVGLVMLKHHMDSMEFARIEMNKQLEQERINQEMQLKREKQEKEMQVQQEKIDKEIQLEAKRLKLQFEKDLIDKEAQMRKDENDFKREKLDKEMQREQERNERDVQIEREKTQQQSINAQKELYLKAMEPVLIGEETTVDDGYFSDAKTTKKTYRTFEEQGMDRFKISYDGADNAHNRHGHGYQQNGRHQDERHYQQNGRHYDDEL